MNQDNYNDRSGNMIWDRAFLWCKSKSAGRSLSDLPSSPDVTLGGWTEPSMLLDNIRFFKNCDVQPKEEQSVVGIIRISIQL